MLLGFPANRGEEGGLSAFLRGAGRGFASIRMLFQAARFVALPYQATVTIDLASGRNFNVGTLTGNLTLAFVNTSMVEGWSGTIRLVQDGTGSRTLSISGLGVTVIAPGGTTPAIDATANRVTLIHWLALPGGILRIGGEQVR
jgi:hypothetical protein